MLKAILAQSKDMVIGTTGKGGPCLPWRLSPDLRRFKQLTEGHAVIMGRTTFDTIGKPLPNRRNIVVSRKPPSEWATPPGDAEWAPSPEQALTMAFSSDRDPFVIGGGEIYSALWQRVDWIELTTVDILVGLGLVFTWRTEPFRVVSRSGPLVCDELPYEFITYERIPAREGVINMFGPSGEP
jgi:dihydrofolate reductase